MNHPQYIFLTALLVVATGCDYLSVGGGGIQGELKDHALRQLFESKYSLTKPGGYCDHAELPRLTDIQFGTISRSPVDLPHPIPAIIARHDFICVNDLLATKEANLDQWVILALDKEFNMVRCLRTGPRKFIDELIDQCQFVATQKR